MDGFFDCGADDAAADARGTFYAPSGARFHCTSCHGELTARAIDPRRHLPCEEAGLWR